MIFQYELINPAVDKKLPRLEGAFLVYPNIGRLYQYYIECKRYNPNIVRYEYFILLGITKFDEQCKKCRVDDYGRLKARLHGEFLEYVTDNAKTYGNVRMEYVESTDTFDVYEIL